MMMMDDWTLSLLAAGANIEVVGGWWSKYPLLVASIKGDANAVGALLAAGADTEAGETGKTARELALQFKQSEIIRILDATSAARAEGAGLVAIAALGAGRAPFPPVSV